MEPIVSLANVFTSQIIYFWIVVIFSVSHACSKNISKASFILIFSAFCGFLRVSPTFLFFALLLVTMPALFNVTYSAHAHKNQPDALSLQEKAQVVNTNLELIKHLMKQRY